MRVVLFIALLMTVNLVFGQHHEFQSLYMYDALTINPAYAGNKGALVLNANYRNQWAGLKGAPQTISFTSHLLTKSKSHGLGLIVLNDKFGINNNLKVNAVYSYKLNFKKSVLSFGIAGGIREESIDRNALNLNDASDASFMNLPERSLVPDVNFGIMYKRDHFLAGFSIPNIARTKGASVEQAANMYLGNLIDLTKELKLKPSVLLKYIINSPLSYEGNLTVYYGDKISAGAGFPSVYMEINQNLAIFIITKVVLILPLISFYRWDFHQVIHSGRNQQQNGVLKKSGAAKIFKTTTV